MKKVSSDVEFVFPYDGETKVNINKKGTLVEDNVGEEIRKRYPFVVVEDAKAPKTKTDKEEKKEEKKEEAPAEEVVTDEAPKEEEKEKKPAKKTVAKKTK